jgi:hypothetical protein
MPAVNGFTLTENDIEILKQVYEHRLLQVDHLIALTERPHKQLHRRLLKLIERNYLARIVLPAQKHIYTLGRAAAPALVEQGIAPKELIDFRLRHHELKELFLKHTMMIVEIHATLELAARNSHIKLAAWKEGEEIYDSINVSEHGRQRRLPVRPDGFFTLQDTNRPPDRNRIHFMLEADRSTTTQTRFKDKIVAYWNYLQSGKQEQRYGIKHFRVVTVTLTDARAANLAQMAVEVTPPQLRKFFLFTSLKHFSIEHPTTILNDIFITPRESQSERVRLVPQ